MDDLVLGGSLALPHILHVYPSTTVPPPAEIHDYPYSTYGIAYDLFTASLTEMAPYGWGLNTGMYWLG
jgi:hypothetical protein